MDKLVSAGLSSLAGRIKNMMVTGLFLLCVFIVLSNGKIQSHLSMYGVIGDGCMFFFLQLSYSPYVKLVSLKQDPV